MGLRDSVVEYELRLARDLAELERVVHEQEYVDIIRIGFDVTKEPKIET